MWLFVFYVIFRSVLYFLSQLAETSRRGRWTQKMSVGVLGRRLPSRGPRELYRRRWRGVSSRKRRNCPFTSLRVFTGSAGRLRFKNIPKRGGRAGNILWETPPSFSRQTQTKVTTFKRRHDNPIYFTEVFTHFHFLSLFLRTLLSVKLEIVNDRRRKLSSMYGTSLCWTYNFLKSHRRCSSGPSWTPRVSSFTEKKRPNTPYLNLDT